MHIYLNWIREKCGNNLSMVVDFKKTTENNKISYFK